MMEVVHGCGIMCEEEREFQRKRRGKNLNAHCVRCVNSLSRQLDVFVSAIQIHIVDRRSWCGIGLQVAFMIKHGDLLVSHSLSVCFSPYFSKLRFASFDSSQAQFMPALLVVLTYHFQSIGVVEFFSAISQIHASCLQIAISLGMNKTCHLSLINCSSSPFFALNFGFISQVFFQVFFPCGSFLAPL